MLSTPRLYADVLIVGSGLAGLLLALKLAQNEDVSIVLASKGALSDSNSTYAQGGLAAVTDANAFDSPEAHLLDTLKSGAGLTDEAAARGIIFSGRRLIEELGSFGVIFDKKDNVYQLALEGGHSQARVLHNKDATGRAITSALADRLKAIASNTNRVTIFENAYAHELVVENGKCVGAQIELAGDGLLINAPHTVLATGGIGQLYKRTTNPLVATGDGIALAYRAGARLSDMEFVQFHPTALVKDGAPAFLISEAVRGAGAILTDHKGKRFVQRFHQDGELATRDIVARAIHTVMHEHGISSVYLDMRSIAKAEIESHFPNIQKRMSEYGIDIFKEPIPVAPAAHYFMGGIDATIDGQTSLPGLYAIGECASTGLHGGNRLASNSLLEAGVMALRLSDQLSNPELALPVGNKLEQSSELDPPYLVPQDLEQLQTSMYRHAGLVRSEAGLSILLKELKDRTLQSDPARLSSARSMLEVGQLIAQAALLRRESRGAHFREDYPTTDSVHFGRRLWMSKTGSGWSIPLTNETVAYRQAALPA